MFAFGIAIRQKNLYNSSVEVQEETVNGQKVNLLRGLPNKIVLRTAAIAVALTGVCLSGAAPAFAQRGQPLPPPPAQANQNTPPLRVTSRVVQVNVIVHDKNGQPVSGLTKKDFTILDQGQPQTIASFSEERNTVATTAAALAPNTFSNRFQERYGFSPSVSVILIDALNTPFADRVSAREQVIKFLGPLQPQDRVALYFLSDKIYIAHEFTTDTAALLRSMGVLPRFKQDSAATGPSMDFAIPTGNADDDAWQRAVVGVSRSFDMEARARKTAAALRVIANHLAGVPGRKNLIWISDSFPFQINLMGSPIGTVGADGPESFSDDVAKTANALSNANIAIYPIDARGLTVRSPGQVERDSRTTTIVFADLTGGRAFHDTNDISGAIHSVLDDSRVTYTLTYYPNHNQWNGQFREIKVKVDHPGVEVRSRTGYFASTDPVVSPQDKEEIMVDAAKNSLESTALGMDVHADPADVPGARQIKTLVRIDPSQLQLAKAGDHWTDSIDIKWVQIAAGGEVLASTSQTLNLNIPQVDFENVLRKGLSFSGNVSLADGATDVRLVARDSGNGSVGTVNIPVAKLFAPAATPPEKKN
jgi:VWFA-related protein